MSPLSAFLIDSAVAFELGDTQGAHNGTTFLGAFADRQSLLVNV